MDYDENCKYCSINYQTSSRVKLENPYWFANFDNHPFNTGHMKLVSKRHENSFDELSNEEVIAFIDILRKAKALIKRDYVPNGWNIGINEGGAAGQTVFHLPVHLIPRYEGDVEDPTGGIRNSIQRKNLLEIS